MYLYVCACTCVCVNISTHICVYVFYIYLNVLYSSCCFVICFFIDHEHYFRLKILLVAALYMTIALFIILFIINLCFLHLRVAIILIQSLFLQLLKVDLLDQNESISLKHLIHTDLLPSRKVYQFIIPIYEKGLPPTHLPAEQIIFLIHANLKGIKWHFILF